MSQEFRIKDKGYINRNKVINFKFNGKSYTGYEGDTLASALLANGIHLGGATPAQQPGGAGPSAPDDHRLDGPGAGRQSHRHLQAAGSLPRSQVAPAGQTTARGS